MESKYKNKRIKNRYPVYFEDKELNLNKTNIQLAREIGLDDPSEFVEVRKMAMNGNVYLDFNPYHSDVNQTKTLIMDYDRDTLIERCYESAQDI